MSVLTINLPVGVGDPPCHCQTTSSEGLSSSWAGEGPLPVVGTACRSLVALPGLRLLGEVEAG